MLCKCVHMHIARVQRCVRVCVRVREVLQCGVYVRGASDSLQVVCTDPSCQRALLRALLATAAGMPNCAAAHPAGSTATSHAAVIAEPPSTYAAHSTVTCLLLVSS